VTKQIQLLCAWSGPAVVLVVSVGFFIAGVLPLPLRPSSTTEKW